MLHNGVRKCLPYTAVWEALWQCDYSKGASKIKLHPCVKSLTKWLVLNDKIGFNVAHHKIGREYESSDKRTNY